MFVNYVKAYEDTCYLCDRSTKQWNQRKYNISYNPTTLMSLLCSASSCVYYSMIVLIMLMYVGFREHYFHQVNILSINFLEW